MAAPGPRGDPSTDVACKSDHGCLVSLTVSRAAPPFRPPSSTPFPTPDTPYLSEWLLCPRRINLPTTMSVDTVLPRKLPSVGGRNVFTESMSSQDWVFSDR